MNRIYRSLRSVDWKHALGEVSLIIIGILAALAADAWWDDRKDDRTARAYLHQLLVDVDANESAIGEVTSGHSPSTNAATRLESAFDAEGPLPPCDTMAEMLMSTLQWTSLNLRTGTYAALLATGDIRLIRGDSLRTEVIRYAGVVETVTENLARNESWAWDSAQTFRRRVTFFWRLFEPRQPSDPQPWAGCEFEPLRHDPDVREALFSLHLLHENRIGFANELAAANRQLRVHLRAELGVAAPEAGTPAR